MSTPEFPKEGTGGRPLAKPSTWSIVLVVAVVLAIWMAETPPVQETDRVCVSAATCIRWRTPPASGRMPLLAPGNSTECS